MNILASPSPQTRPKSRSVGPAEQGTDQNSGLRQAVWSDFRYFQIALIRVCNPLTVKSIASILFLMPYDFWLKPVTLSLRSLSFPLYDGNTVDLL